MHAVKHWKLMGRDAFRCMYDLRHLEATWFIDAPYVFNYQYRQGPVAYSDLAESILAKHGQRIACEAACPKTAAVPVWLPFKPFGEHVTSRRKAHNHHHSKELIWVSANRKPVCG